LLFFLTISFALVARCFSFL